MSEATEKIWIKPEFAKEIAEQPRYGFHSLYIRSDLVEDEIDMMKMQNAQAFSAGWDAGKQDADTEVARLSAEIERMREALITIRDKRSQCNRASDCQAVARSALKESNQ